MTLPRFTAGGKPSWNGKYAWFSAHVLTGRLAGEIMRARVIDLDGWLGLS